MTTFKVNLQMLSESKGDDFINEWFIEARLVCDKFACENRCICSRQIKIIWVVRNETNGNFVQMGTECVKKLAGNNINLSTNKKVMDKNIIKKFQQGIFVPITNLQDYSINVFKQYSYTVTAKELLAFYEIYKTNHVVREILFETRNKKFKKIEKKMYWWDKKLKEYEVDSDDLIEALKDLNITIKKDRIYGECMSCNDNRTDIRYRRFGYYYRDEEISDDPDDYECDEDYRDALAAIDICRQHSGDICYGCIHMYDSLENIRFLNSREIDMEWEGSVE